MLAVCFKCGSKTEVSSLTRGMKCMHCQGGLRAVQSISPSLRSDPITYNIIPQGKCKNCGIWIPGSRLKAEPGARFCIDCQPRGLRQVNPWTKS